MQQTFPGHNDRIAMLAITADFKFPMEALAKTANSELRAYVGTLGEVVTRDIAHGGLSMLLIMDSRHRGPSSF